MRSITKCGGVENHLTCFLSSVAKIRKNFNSYQLWVVISWMLKILLDAAYFTLALLIIQTCITSAVTIYNSWVAFSSQFSSSQPRSATRSSKKDPWADHELGGNLANRHDSWDSKKTISDSYDPDRTINHSRDSERACSTPWWLWTRGQLWSWFRG